MPIIDAAALNGHADPIPTNDPLLVALNLPDDEYANKRRVTFEELIAEDEIDVPDFMK
jgi:cell division protein FtsZ